MITRLSSFIALLHFLPSEFQTKKKLSFFAHIHRVARSTRGLNNLQNFSTNFLLHLQIFSKKSANRLVAAAWKHLHVRRSEETIKIESTRKCQRRWKMHYANIHPATLRAVTRGKSVSQRVHSVQIFSRRSVARPRFVFKLRTLATGTSMEY